MSEHERELLRCAWSAGAMFLALLYPPTLLATADEVIE